MDLHHWAGYVASALILFRLVWGITGPHYARFAQFVRRPVETIGFLKLMTQRREARYIGHNPAGALMILGLMLVVSVTCATGWMYTLDAFWGVDWVESVHELAANLMLGMVVVHVLGVLTASFHHRENLVRAMIDGRKREAGTGDVS